MAFFAQNKAKLYKNWIITLPFEKHRPPVLQLPDKSVFAFLRTEGWTLILARFGLSLRKFFSHLSGIDKTNKNQQKPKKPWLEFGQSILVILWIRIRWYNEVVVRSVLNFMKAGIHACVVSVFFFLLKKLEILKNLLQNR
jgi:hypothetical protein